MSKLLLYIDPGTGSMLFAAMIGIVSTLYFMGQQLWLKIKYRGGKVEADKDRKALVIFGEGGQYWKIFKPVCDELEKRGIDCEYYTMDEKDAALSADYSHIKVSFIGTGNRAFAKLNLMNAALCLSTTPGLGVYQWKRSKNVGKYIHIYHAVGDGTGYRMFALDDYDAILMTGAFQEDRIRQLESMRNESPKELKVVGCTYLDGLLKRKETENISASDEVTILLAPSWGKSAILSRYGSKIIKALKDTGFHIIIRPHPQTIISESDIISPLRTEFENDEQIEWDTSHDNFTSLSRASIMITDFSGIMFDYSLIFDKPIIYADVNFDKSVYDAAWFEDLPWHIANLPRIGRKLSEEDFPDMKNIIEQMINSKEYADGINEIRNTVWQERGSSARNIADYITDQLSSSRQENTTDTQAT